MSSKTRQMKATTERPGFGNLFRLIMECVPNPNDRRYLMFSVACVRHNRFGEKSADEYEQTGMWGKRCNDGVNPHYFSEQRWAREWAFGPNHNGMDRYRIADCIFGKFTDPRITFDRCPWCRTDDMTEREGRLLRCNGCDNTTDVHPWLTPTVLSLAQAAYDDLTATCTRCQGKGFLVNTANPGFCARCFGKGFIYVGHLRNDNLAVLSDALEEAGCNSLEILEHLRDGKKHWRGCHVLDAILELRKRKGRVHDYP